VEIARKIALGEEMDEQAAVASKTPMPEDLSIIECEPNVPVEEVMTKKKPNKKPNKKAKTTKVVKEK
jgi:hypothetical protein